MTKRHFERAAEIVRNTRLPHDREAIEHAFATLFAEFNARFRPEQFHAACTGEDYDVPTYSGRRLTRRYSNGS